MFIVICNDKGFEYIPQRRLIDAESWDATVQHIAEGQWEDIYQVHSTGHPNEDVLPIMAREVQNIWADREEKQTEWQNEFVSRFVTGRAPNKFAQAAE